MKLIINADDIGYSKSITDGIIEGINYGCISSTSIMANMEYAEYAIKQLIKNNIKEIGLHVTLTVGKPLTNCPSLVDEHGEFLYNRKQIENPNLNAEEVYNEIMAQINFVEKFGKGKIKINHLTRHHHLEDNSTLNEVIERICLQKKLPMRKCEVFKTKCNHPDEFITSFSFRSNTVEELKSIINRFKDTNKIVEILTHAGYIDEYTSKISSQDSRERELTALKKAKDLGVFDNVKLVGYEYYH